MFLDLKALYARYGVGELPCGLTLKRFGKNLELHKDGREIASNQERIKEIRWILSLHSHVIYLQNNEKIILTEEEYKTCVKENYDCFHYR